MRLSEVLMRPLPPKMAPKDRKRILWGAQLAGQLLAEVIDATRVDDRDEPKISKVKNGLLEILKSGELPALERVKSGNALAKLGDPRFLLNAWKLKIKSWKLKTVDNHLQKQVLHFSL